MTTQESLFPEPEQTPFDVDAAIEAIKAATSTPAHQKSVERAYNREADRLGLLDEEVSPDRNNIPESVREAREALNPRTTRPLGNSALNGTPKYIEGRERILGNKKGK